MNKDDAVWIGVTTFPSVELARKIAHTLVSEELAACFNLIPKIESIYRWQGKIETGSEVLAVVKFKGTNEPAVRDRLLALHPYEVAEWIAWPVQSGAPLYLNWVRNSEG